MAEPSVLLGRDAEMASSVAVVTADLPGDVLITGPPGVGKTAFASALMRHAAVAERFASRICFVNVRSTETVGVLIRTILAKLGAPAPSGSVEQLVRMLHSAPALLVMDDADIQAHPDPLAFDEVAAQISRVPLVSIVATARSRQGSFSIRWTRIIELPQLDRDAARQLLIRSAPGSKITGLEADALLERTGHVPFVVELAGKALKKGSDPSAFLRAMNDGAPREDSSIAVLANRVLDAVEGVPVLRQTAALLAELPDGASKELLGTLPAQVRAAASELKKLGLLDEYPQRVCSRVRVLDGRNPLGEVQPDHRLVVEKYFIDLVERHSGQIGRKGGGRAHQLLSRDSRNIEWALRSAMRGPAPMDGARAAIAFANFMRNSGQGTIDLLEAAVAVSRTANEPRAVADGLRWLGDVAQSRFENDKAVESYNTARGLYDRLGDLQGVADCVSNHANVELRRRHWEAATGLFNEALAIYRRISDERGEALCMERLGDIAYEKSCFETASSHLNEALEKYTKIPDLRGQANCLLTLGTIHGDRGEWEQATKVLSRSRQIHEKIGHRLGVANATFGLAVVELRQQHREKARELLEQAAVVYRSLDNRPGEANCIYELGGALSADGDFSGAKATFEQALALYRRIGDIRGEANCIKGLGDIEAAANRPVDARKLYLESLPLFLQVSDPLATAAAYYGVAHVEADPAERRRYLEKAVEAYRASGRSELVDKVLSELKGSA